MARNEQTDFFKSLDNGSNRQYINPIFNPLLERRINDYKQATQARDARVGYGEKHAEPGEVYLMLGLLRGFRIKAKIGLSRNHKERLVYLKDDFGRFIIPIFVVSTNNMIRLEKAAHTRFDAHREPEAAGSGKTEWFRINPIRLIKMIWFLYMKEKQFHYGDRIESFKNVFRFR
jgi:hypothetical protein